MKAGRRFGLTALLPCLAIALIPLAHGQPVRVWALGAAAAVALVTLVRPALLLPLEHAAQQAGGALRRILNALTTGMLFVGIVTPLALALRLAGRDPLHRKWDSRAHSYWIDRHPPGPAGDSLRDQF